MLSSGFTEALDSPSAGLHTRMSFGNPIYELKAFETQTFPGRSCRRTLGESCLSLGAVPKLGCFKDVMSMYLSFSTRSSSESLSEIEYRARTADSVSPICQLQTRTLTAA